MIENSFLSMICANSWLPLNNSFGNRSPSDQFGGDVKVNETL